MIQSCQQPLEQSFLPFLFAVSVNFASTNPGIIAAGHLVRFSSIIAAVSLLMATIAETSRIPVDNQETHLELTMIHEAMALEYSGRSLALVELASHIKQIIFFTIIANVVLPVGGGVIVYLAKIMIISVIISIVEVSIAKMRLFRAVDYITFALVAAMAALVISAAGF